MSGKLLDTNAVIALQKGDKGMIEFMTKNKVVVPSVVLGELYYGAYRSDRVEENLKVVEDFANSSKTLDCNLVTAKIYGTIKQQLKTKGRAISENDLWIAALARQHNIILVTRDKDFDAVDDLTLESW